MRRVAIFGLVLAAAGAVRADWPQLYGPNRDGVSTERVTLARSWPETPLPLDWAPEASRYRGPPVRWTVEVGLGWGGAAVADGRVYLLDRPDDRREVLRVFDLEDGRELWRHEYQAPGRLYYRGSRMVPTVAEGHVVTFGTFGHVTCFSLETHESVWTVNVVDDYGGTFHKWGHATAPLVLDGRVILAPQTEEAGLVALDLATGKERWRTGSIGPLGWASPIVVTVDGVRLIVMESGDRVVGVDPADGRVLWTWDDWHCKHLVPTPTACGDGRLFVTGGYEAGSAMLKAERGPGGAWAARTLWKSDACNSHIHSAVLWEGHLYAASNSFESRDGLVCLDLAGNLKWKTGRDPNFDRGNLIVADGMIVALDGQTGELVLVDPSPEAYKELARAKVADGKDLWAPMAISRGRLIVRTHGMLRCLDLRSGAKPAAPAAPPGSAD